MYQKADYERAIELAASGALHLDEMITGHFSFRDYLSAYETIEAAHGNSLKMMIDLD